MQRKEVCEVVEVPDRYAVNEVPVGGVVKLNFVSLTLDNKKFSRRSTGVDYLVARGWSEGDADAYLNSIRTHVAIVAEVRPRHGRNS